VIKPSDIDIHADCILTLGGVGKTVRQWAAWRGIKTESLLRELRYGVHLIDALDMMRQGRPTKPGTLRHRIRNIEARCAQLWNAPCFTPPRLIYFDAPPSQVLRDRVHRLMQDVRSLDIQGDQRWEFFFWLPRGHQLSDKIAFCEERMDVIEQCISRAE